MIKFQNNAPIIVLIGESATGKDTMKEQLLKSLNAHNSISYTTRPMRDGEVEGKEYYFINSNEFKKLKENNQILEHTEYLVCDKLFEYGLGLNSFVNDKINVVIVNPIGLKQLVLNEQIKERLFIVRMSLPDEEIKKRYFEREKNSNLKNLSERFEARLKRDKEDFKDLDEVISKYELKNIKVSNFNVNVCKSEIVKNFYESLIGRQLKIENMDGEDAYKNKSGTIQHIDDLNHIWGTWGGCSVIPTIDEVTIC
jgi:guanylate kinase